MKTILISIDGMRPDGFLQCGNPYIHEMMKTFSYTLHAKTQTPSVTLPCHMSLFHSVPPCRHGMLTNTYTPPVRPVDGLFEKLKAAGKTSAMYYGWEPLRDVSRPGSLLYSVYYNARLPENTDRILTDAAIARIEESHPDFVFLYLVETDEKGGHDCGWMSAQYLQQINNAISCVQSVMEHAGDEYAVIVTADHGGHDRVHGTLMDEDMTIPMFFHGTMFTPGERTDSLTILDIAPTVASLMGILPCEDWEGSSITEAN